MPEGDTVWLVARNLDRALGRRTLVSADLRVPALATTDLAGREVLEVVPPGSGAGSPCTPTCDWTACGTCSTTATRGPADPTTR